MGLVGAELFGGLPEAFPPPSPNAFILEPRLVLDFPKPSVDFHGLDAGPLVQPIFRAPWVVSAL